MAKKRKVGRPRLYKAPERLTVWMPDTLMRRLEKRADLDHRSLNAMVVEILTKGLKS